MVSAAWPCSRIPSSLKSDRAALGIEVPRITEPQPHRTWPSSAISSTLLPGDGAVFGHRDSVASQGAARPDGNLFHEGPALAHLALPQKLAYAPR